MWFYQCAPTCSNLVKTGDEACDDGNTANNDRCSSTCTVEGGYACAESSTCSSSTSSEVCGDGKLVGDEACDDSSTASGDGCSDACTVECGFVCDSAEP